MLLLLRIGDIPLPMLSILATAHMSTVSCMLLCSHASASQLMCIFVHHAQNTASNGDDHIHQHAARSVIVVTSMLVEF